MKNQLLPLFLIGIALFALNYRAKAQVEQLHERNNSRQKILELFEQSIRAAENLDTEFMLKLVNDTSKTGFIDNGLYFESYEELMNSYKKGIQNIYTQYLKVKKTKITFLSEKMALLTTNGYYSAQTIQKREISGKFAWTIVYSRIDSEWKIVHSHMSNPK